MLRSKPKSCVSLPPVDRFGKLSALVNNAATRETPMRLDAMDSARMYRTFATNVVGISMHD